MECDLVPNALFCYRSKAKKKPWSTSNTGLKFAQIDCIFFRINYGKQGNQYRNINNFSCQMSGQVVRTVEEKNKMKMYEQKVISLYGQLYPYRLGMGQRSLRVKNGKKQGFESRQVKVDSRIQILQLTRSSSKKKQKRIRDEQKKMVLQLQLGSRLDWKRVDTFQASHKLNSD